MRYHSDESRLSRTPLAFPTNYCYLWSMLATREHKRWSRIFKALRAKGDNLNLLSSDHRHIQGYRSQKSTANIVEMRSSKKQPTYYGAKSTVMLVSQNFWLQVFLANHPQS